MMFFFAMTAGFIFICGLCTFLWLMWKLFDWWMDRDVARMMRREMKERGVPPREIEEIMRKSPVRQ